MPKPHVSRHRVWIQLSVSIEGPLPKRTQFFCNLSALRVAVPRLGPKTVIISPFQSL